MIPSVPQSHFPSPYLRPQTPPSKACYVTTRDGARIACFVYGDSLAKKEGQTKAPVLFLHGNGEEHGIFGPIIDDVVASGRVTLALDSRAQGKSTRGSAPLSYELMRDDALTVLDALAIDKVHVLGFSDGGIEALLLARDKPERVASITVLGANLTPDGVVDEGWDIEEAVNSLDAWAKHRWSHAIDTSLLSPTPCEAQTNAELLRLMLEEPHIEAASLSAISCPAEIVVGEFDCIRDDETVAIVRAIPQARLSIVPGQGHTLPKHAPAAISALLFSAIKRAFE